MWIPAHKLHSENSNLFRLLHEVSGINKTGLFLMTHPCIRLTIKILPCIQGSFMRVIYYVLTISLGASFPLPILQIRNLQRVPHYYWQKVSELKLYLSPYTKSSEFVPQYILTLGSSDCPRSMAAVPGYPEGQSDLVKTPSLSNSTRIKSICGECWF